MTRKHYEAFAEVFRNSFLSLPEEEYAQMRTEVYNEAVENVIMDFVPILAADNPNFDRVRFLTACGYYA